MQISFTKRKIQYLYLGLIVVSLLLGLVSYARAQEAGSQEAAVNTAMPARKGLTQAQQDRFINLVRNVYTRLEAAANRLNNIVVRIDERIVILNSQGVDTSEALVPFNQAKSRLSAITSALQEAKASAESGIVSDTPRERFTTARTQFLNIHKALREAFLLLRETVSALKDAAKEAELNKSSAVSESETTVAPTNPN
jgi:hypothetical protein